MSVFRINKTEDYTVMSNHHLKNKEMSLKAKGLLSQMLSLPNEWDYSVAGLVAINKENKSSIQGVLKELEDFGYLVRTRSQNIKGQFEYIYDIYEKPQTENPCTENPFTDKPCTDNQPQLNTNKSNIKKLNTKYIYMGIYKRVKLTEEQYNKLVEEFGEDYINNIINRLDEYIESNNNKNKYSNYNLVIRKAIREKWFDIKDISSPKKVIPEWFDKEINESEPTSEETTEMDADLKEIQEFLKIQKNKEE